MELLSGDYQLGSFPGVKIKIQTLSLIFIGRGGLDDIVCSDGSQVEVLCQYS